MSKAPGIFSLLASGIALLLLVGVGGCGPTHTGLCERAADCGEGRDPEIEACVVEMDAREEQADIFDCTDEWDTYIDCLDESGSCVDGALGGCTTDHMALDECIHRRRSGSARIELKAGD